MANIAGKAVLSETGRNARHLAQGPLPGPFRVPRLRVSAEGALLVNAATAFRPAIPGAAREPAFQRVERSLVGSRFKINGFRY
jgi:hypothetical protein